MKMHKVSFAKKNMGRITRGGRRIERLCDDQYLLPGGGGGRSRRQDYRGSLEADR